MTKNSTPLAKTPLYDLHERCGGKLVPFAGYEMPVQFGLGIMKEHLHTRSAAGLFDVSHMGQIKLHPKSGSIEEVALALEQLVVADILALKSGRQRYALFTNEAGGVLDDLMVANLGDALFLVVNAACKQQDLALLQTYLSEICEIEPLETRALIALQGPEAETVLTRLGVMVEDLRFMDVVERPIQNADCIIARAGYTGEDGFEISVPAESAPKLAEALLAETEVEPIGLGARDSLRLEAGLCLYGQDLDTEITVIEAALEWALQKSRRSGGKRAGGFPGATRILSELDTGSARQRVGLIPEGPAPVRPGALLFAQSTGGEPIGQVTSGGFSPSLERPIAMGYVTTLHLSKQTDLYVELRSKRLPIRVTELPFVAHKYKR